MGFSSAAWAAKVRSCLATSLVHTSPTRSAAGLEAIYLMAYDYLLPYERRPEDVRKFQQTIMADPAQRGRIARLDMLEGDFTRQLKEQETRFMKWLRRCEAGLDLTPKSIRLLTDSFFHVGASRYDAVVTYEHLAFDLFRQIDEFGGAVASMGYGSGLFFPKTGEFPLSYSGSERLASGP